MGRIARSVSMISIAGMTVLGPGCGTLAPTSIELVEGRRFGSGDVLVLGRLTKVDADGDTIEFGEPRWVDLILVGYTDITMLHMRDNDRVELQTPLRGDGTFIWHLKPGTYSLIGMTQYHGAGYVSQYWAQAETFSLLPTDSGVYIGTLLVTDAGRWVRDDYQKSLQVLETRLPGITFRPVRRLMRDGSGQGPLAGPDPSLPNVQLETEKKPLQNEICVGLGNAVAFENQPANLPGEARATPLAAVSIAFRYYLTEMLSLGGHIYGYGARDLSYVVQDNEGTINNVTYPLATFNIGVQCRYAFVRSSWMPFVCGVVNYSEAVLGDQQNATLTARGFSIGGGAGVSFFLSQHVALSAECIGSIGWASWEQKPFVNSTGTGFHPSMVVFLGGVSYLF